MSVLQIVLLSVSGAFALASIVFMIMFIVEITVSPKEEEISHEVQSVFTVNVISDNSNDDDVDAMLAKLDAETKDEEIEENPVEEVVENQIAEEIEEESIEEKEESTNNIESSLLGAFIDEVEETAEEDKTQEQEVEDAEEKAEKQEIVEKTAEKVEENQKEQEEVVVENAEIETVEEVKEDKTSKDSKDAEEDDSDDAEDDADDEILEYSDLKEEPIEVSNAGSIDYSARLEKIIASRDKIERDLAKVQKAILKYERTKRRKNRNQKMLDRRAGELTNLNLLMYSVTDIKNVDEDKKVKQEELTAHIAELKASIQDAEEYIESNKEKNDHNLKMAKFLLHEKARYNEEIVELQNLINKADEDNK